VIKEATEEMVNKFYDIDYKDEDKFQGSGLGTKFMETLIDIEQKRGLKSIYGGTLTFCALSPRSSLPPASGPWPAHQDDSPPPKCKKR
jgi:hypothetical protein